MCSMFISTYICQNAFLIMKQIKSNTRNRRADETLEASSSSSSFEGYPLQVRHKQDWGRGFMLLITQAAALPELHIDAGSDVIKPASSFVIQNRQNSCSMWCPMCRVRC